MSTSQRRLTGTLDCRFKALIKSVLGPQLRSMKKLMLDEIKELKREVRESLQEYSPQQQSLKSEIIDCIKQELQDSATRIDNENQKFHRELSSKFKKDILSSLKAIRKTRDDKADEVNKSNSETRPGFIISETRDEPDPGVSDAPTTTTALGTHCLSSLPIPKKKSYAAAAASTNNTTNPLTPTKRLTSKSALEIMAKTKEDDLELTRKEVKEVMSGKLNQPTGSIRSTLQNGKTVQDLALLIPKDYHVTLAVELNNLLEVPLDDPECWLDCGVKYTPEPKKVEGGAEKVFTYHDNGYAASGVNGLLSYKIAFTDLRLAVSFGIDRSGSTLLAAAFIPKDVSAGEMLDDLMWNTVQQDELRSDIQCANWSKEKKELIIKMKNMRACVTMSLGPRAVLKICVLQIMSSSVVQDLEEELLSSLTSSKVEIKKPGSLHVKPRNGNVIEITNLIKANLQDPQSFPLTREIKESVPGVIPELTRTTFTIPSSTHAQSEAQVLFSYRLDSTDIRLALAFRISAEGNSFGVAFVTQSALMDSSLFTAMTKHDEWITRQDRKFSLASGGSIVAETRNIRAKVTMSNEPKAFISLTLSLC